MTEFEKIWIDQCEAAWSTREAHGPEHAAGYLVGEKLVNFVPASDTHPEFTRERPRFVVQIRRSFTQHELRDSLEGLRRVGALAHVCTDEETDTLRAAEAIDEDPVSDAEDLMIVERIKEELLEG